MRRFFETVGLLVMLVCAAAVGVFVARLAWRGLWVQACDGEPASQVQIGGYHPVDASDDDTEARSQVGF